MGPRGLGPAGFLILVSGGAAGLSAQDQAVCLPVRVSPLRTDAPVLARPKPERAPLATWVRPGGRLCASLGGLVSSGASPQAFEEADVGPGRAFLYSAVLPGAGQRLLGQPRWAAYAAIEVWGWIRFLSLRRDGGDLRDRYRDLAWLVARRISQGPRRDGDFEYYEAMTHFTASGAYDRDPLRPGIQPEADSTTFNGSIWKLARDIFFSPDSAEAPDEGSPEYQRALEYYQSRGYTSEFAWSWGDNELQRAAFEDLIEESDTNLRRSTTMIGVLLANRFLSAVDGLVSARLRRMGRSRAEFSARTVPLDPYGRWALEVEIRP